MTGGPHITKWIVTNGDGPWLCGRCGELILTLGGSVSSEMGIIHHVDEDTSNNDIANLRAMHHACHIAYHNGKRIISEETRQKMSAAQKQRRANEPPEIRDKFVRSMTGKTHTEETRQKISASNKGKTISEATRKKLAEASRGNKNMVGRTVSEEPRRKIAE